MSQASFIDQRALDTLVREAADTPRRRLNRNLHADNAALCHRLLIATEPGSYTPPHCHADPTKDESIIVLRGRLGVLVFDAEGNITQQAVLTAGGETLVVNIPHGVIHTLVALEPGSVFFESKAGPYAPPTPAERPAWAPPENTPEAPAYLAALVARFTG